MKKLCCAALLLSALTGVCSSPAVSEQEWTGQELSFDFKDIDIRDLFLVFADISELNVVLDPGVKGNVTLKLINVPWDQALDIVTKNQGLGYTFEGKVIRIAPLPKFIQEMKSREAFERQLALNAPLVTRLIPLNYAKAAEIERVVKRLLTPKGSCIADPRTNTLIITDIASNIDAIQNAINGLE